MVETMEGGAMVKPWCRGQAEPRGCQTELELVEMETQAEPKRQYD